MKEVRIFVASSKELIAERNNLAYMTLSLEEEFERKGLRVRLAKWEYVDPKMTGGRTEDRYLEEMYNCDAALILFKDIAGKYTREELDKALKKENEGTARLKTHCILFRTDGSQDSEAAKLKKLLPEGSYGTYSDMSELRDEFLKLIDSVAASGKLTEIADGGHRVVNAFLAADDELALDRNAFADMILNLNDILDRRGIRVQLRFYDEKKHKEMLENSEMALVLYHTNYNAFGPEQMRDAYDRTKREENPRKLYVFFRGENGEALDPDFIQFREGFSEKIGHFFCQFENADTLKLNFLLSLESTLGEGASFVRLDGRNIKVGELDVAEITKLPMVANNAGLTDLMSRLDQIKSAFNDLSARCRQDPMNDELYEKLLEVTAQRDELQGYIERELSQSLNLAKRLSTVSIAEAHSTFMQARYLMESGKIKEAIEILDGASSRISSIRSRFASRSEQEDRDILELIAWKDVELFRMDALLSFSALPFTERFQRAEKTLSELIGAVDECLQACSHRNEGKVLKILADLYSRQGKFYSVNSDSLHAESGYRRALEISMEIEKEEPEYNHKIIADLQVSLAAALQNNANLPESISMYSEALKFYHEKMNFDQDRLDALVGIINCQSGLAHIYDVLNEFQNAEAAYDEALKTCRVLTQISAEEYQPQLADILISIGWFHLLLNDDSHAKCELEEAMAVCRALVERDAEKYEIKLSHCCHVSASCFSRSSDFDSAEKLELECLEIDRRLVEKNPLKYSKTLGSELFSLAIFYRNRKAFDKSEEYFREADVIYKRLVQYNPQAYEETYSRILTNYAMLLEDMDRLKDAENVYAQTLEIRRRLVERDIEHYQYFLANTLIGLSAIYVKQGKYDEAGRGYHEALKIRRGLVVKRPDKFEPDVAGLLLEMAQMLEACGNNEMSGEYLNEATRIFLKWNVPKPWRNASEMMRGYIR